jgi:enoyl-CoA hydratase/carnithine racemase
LGLIADDDGFLDASNNKNTPPSFIREVGCTRRVFLLEPYFQPQEMEALAYRIKTLTKSEALNSVLIATSDVDDAENSLLSSIVDDRESQQQQQESMPMDFPISPDHRFHVAGGYDPLEIYKSGEHKNKEYVMETLQCLTDLASAIRGDAKNSKIPVICIPHGAVTDGGFCFLLASYAIATTETAFRILNPSRGLSLDPVGLSFFLPRLGVEFKQVSQSYKGCGTILALAGYEANYEDMLETGIVTHFMESIQGLGPLENTLSQLPSWNRQSFLKPLVRYEGDPVPAEDRNKDFRNVQVAETIQCFTDARADGTGLFSGPPIVDLDDPSLEPSYIPWTSTRSSDLVNMAAAFDGIFKRHAKLPGILESLNEAGHRSSDDPEEQYASQVAQDLHDRIRKQSPLAVSVIFDLLKRGGQTGQTLSLCTQRERMAQMRMFAHEDFTRWAEHAKEHGPEVPFENWTHKSVEDVTAEEVLEIIEGTPEEREAEAARKAAAMARSMPSFAPTERPQLAPFSPSQQQQPQQQQQQRRQPNYRRNQQQQSNRPRNRKPNN